MIKDTDKQPDKDTQGMVGGGEMGKSSRRLQASSHDMNKFQKSDVQHSDYGQLLKVAKRLDLKNSQHTHTHTHKHRHSNCNYVR